MFSESAQMLTERRRKARRNGLHRGGSPCHSVKIHATIGLDNISVFGGRELTRNVSSAPKSSAALSESILSFASRTWNESPSHAVPIGRSHFVLSGAFSAMQAPSTSESGRAEDGTPPQPPTKSSRQRFKPQLSCTFCRSRKYVPDPLDYACVVLVRSPRLPLWFSAEVS
jgi:hypothetical protein